MKLTIISLALFSTLITLAQDPTYSLENRSAIIFNPALTGIQLNGKISTAYQSYWDKVENAPALANISFDNRVTKLHGGFGAYISHDYYSFYNRTNLGLNYAYHASLTRKLKLSFGVSAILSQQKINIFALPNIILTPIPPINSKEYRVDGTIGSFLYGEKLFWGMTLNNLTNTNTPTRFTTQIGYNVSLLRNKNILLTPTLTYSYQDKYQSILIKLNTTYKWIHLGIGYRQRDSFLFMVGLDYKQFSVNYGYEITTSKLTNYSGGKHQFGLVYKLAKENRHNWKPEGSFNTYLF